MKFDLTSFREWKRKRITLVGMSGVGKSHLSAKLRACDWFHYSGDYRIGTHYLNEYILDMIKQEMIQVPFLRTLLRNDWIYVSNNIRVNDLGPVLSFVGKLGNPELGGVELQDFIERQEIYRQAEVQAMYDLPDFIKRANTIYGYQHFINDVGGSLCELEEPGVIDLLARETLILYIKVSNQEQEDLLIERAQLDPKPLYYRPEFLERHLKMYLEETGLQYAAEIDPDEFARWVFPKLFHSRIPRYDEIVNPHGYTVSSDEVGQVNDEKDFLELLEKAIDSESDTSKP